jgi:hypothetical protein
MMGLERLRGEFDITPLAVYTGDFKPLLKKYDVIGVEHANLPLGKKWNAGLTEALKLPWDYLMTMGSDDLIANELLRLYKWEDEAFGLTRCGILDVRTGEKRIFNNVYPIGLARCIRRDVVERLGDMVTIRYKVSAVGTDFTCTARREVTMTRNNACKLHRVADIIQEHSPEQKLWPDSLNRGLDHGSEMILHKNGIRQTKVLTDSILAVDLKSETNIWPIETYDKEDFEMGFISEGERDAIRRLEQTDSY